MRNNDCRNKSYFLQFLNLGIKTYKYHLHKTVSKKNYISYFSGGFILSVKL